MEVHNDRNNGIVTQDYVHTFETVLAANGISVAISIAGFELTVNENLNFKVINIPLTEYDRLAFRLVINDPAF